MILSTFSRFCLRKMINHKTLSHRNLFFFSKDDTRRWLKEHSSDPFVRKAVAENFRSRSTFKLIEIDTRYQLFRQAKKIIEFGSSPGGWTQAMERRVGAKTRILSIDREEMEPVSTHRSEIELKFVKMDITDKHLPIEIDKFFSGQKVDLILSDMSPNLIGENFRDSEEVSELNAKCVELCELFLVKGGTLLMKTFQGFTEKSNYEFCSLFFQKVERIKPSSSKMKSSEIYFLCSGHQQTKFFDMIAKKGKDISLEEFKQLFLQNGSMSEKQQLELLETIYEMNKNGSLNEKELQFKFEKELFTMRKKPEEKSNRESLKYAEEQLEFAYQEALRQKLVDDIPGSVEEALDRYDKDRLKIQKEINELLGKKTVGRTELLDLDEMIESKNEQNESRLDDKDDFKHPWEAGFDDYEVRLFKKEVLDPLRKGKTPYENEFININENNDDDDEEINFSEKKDMKKEFIIPKELEENYYNDEIDKLVEEMKQNKMKMSEKEKMDEDEENRREEERILKRISEIKDHFDDQKEELEEEFMDKVEKGYERRIEHKEQSDVNRDKQKDINRKKQKHK